MNVHPDLDALSASLDGEDEAARAHVAACDDCAARVASLAAVRDAVARLVPPLAAVRREEALAAALAAFDGGRDAEVAAAARPPERASAAAPVVTLASRRWQWAAGSAVAAVLVLVVGMAALFGRGAERESGDQALTAPAAQDSSKAEGTVSAGAGAGAGGVGAFAGDAAVTSGGDLGELPSLEALRARYATRAEASSTATGNATARGGALASPTTVNATNSGASSATPAAGGVPPPVQVGTRACEIEARAARPSVGVVVYAATARFQGTPAVVLGFAPTAGGPPTVLLVLAEQGCRLLGETLLS